MLENGDLLLYHDSKHGKMYFSIFLFMNHYYAYDVYSLICNDGNLRQSYISQFKKIHLSSVFIHFCEYNYGYVSTSRRTNKED